MNHKEGGWPSNIDPTEPNDITKFRKKVEKNENYGLSVKELCAKVSTCINQNN